MSVVNTLCLKQVLIFLCLVVFVDSKCRPRCKLRLENLGYRTCTREDTRCKKNAEGEERCYEKQPDIQLSANNLKSSTTIVKSSEFFDNPVYAAENVFSGAAGHPDRCNCCWVSHHEANPFLEITFNKEFVMSHMTIIGQNVIPSDVRRNMEYLEVFVNDKKLPDFVYEHNREKNTVTVIGSERKVKKIKFTRPKPEELPGNFWLFFICELEIYAAGDFKE